MSKTLKNSVIYVPSLKRYGKVVTVNPDGTPRTIISKGEVIEIVGLAYKIVGLFKQLLLIVKSLFKKND